MTKKFRKVLQTFIDMNKDVPLGEREWVEYFHDMGRILSGKNLRIRMFHRSLEPNGRHEAWTYLLGVFSSDLTAEEKTRFLFIKTQAYKYLEENWLVRNPLEIDDVNHMLERNILRTDRTHPFFNVPNEY